MDVHNPAMGDVGLDTQKSQGLSLQRSTHRPRVMVDPASSLNISGVHVWQSPGHVSEALKHRFDSAQSESKEQDTSVVLPDVSTHTPVQPVHSVTAHVFSSPRSVDS